MRCFVAVDLAPALRQPLLRLLRDLPRSREVRWCSENQLHITLKFLGDVEDAHVPRVCEAVSTAAAKVQPFPIRLTGLGCFPSPRNPRVLWCGVEDPDCGCARWLELADPLFSDLGFDRETRAFTPHVTLGRSKGRGGGAVMQDVLDNATAPRPVEMTVEEVVLFESRLLPQGAQYTAVHTAKLGDRL